MQASTLLLGNKERSPRSLNSLAMTRGFVIVSEVKQFRWYSDENRDRFTTEVHDDGKVMPDWKKHQYPKALRLGLRKNMFAMTEKRDRRAPALSRWRKREIARKRARDDRGTVAGGSIGGNKGQANQIPKGIRSRPTKKQVRDDGRKKARHDVTDANTLSTLQPCAARRCRLPSSSTLFQLFPGPQRFRLFHAR